MQIRRRDEGARCPGLAVTPWKAQWRELERGLRTEAAALGTRSGGTCLGFRRLGIRIFKLLGGQFHLFRGK